MKKTVSVFVSVLLLAALLQSWAMKESHPATGGRSELNVATFNLRMDTEKDGVNAWPNRKEMVKGLIRFHDFDIFGTQEGFRHMLDGEDAGEHSAIFYKTSRFDLLDKGNFWFSETPDVPGKGWDATCCNRICSWGKFRDKESGKVFYFFNSHYDHQGKVARRESSKLLIARIKQIAGTDAIAAKDIQLISIIKHITHLITLQMTSLNKKGTVILFKQAACSILHFINRMNRLL